MSQFQKFLFTDSTAVAHEYYGRSLKRVFLEDEDTDHKDTGEKDSDDEDTEDEGEQCRIEVRCKSTADLDKYRVRDEPGRNAGRIISTRTAASTNDVKALDKLPGNCVQDTLKEDCKPTVLPAARLTTSRVQVLDLDLDRLLEFVEVSSKACIRCR
jgi:hypothetical protein